jgi:hypothetical protein
MNLMEAKSMINEGKYALLVVKEDGSVGTVEDILVKNGTINDVVTVEKWFNFGKLSETQYMIRLIRKNGETWMQPVDESGTGYWDRI